MLWNYLWPLMVLPLIEAKVSTNARCGYTNSASPGGMTCLRSQWGNCCSQYGYCGTTKDHCGTGCQSAYGTCFKASISSSIRIQTSSSTISTQMSPSAAPSSTLKVSTNARCGFLYDAVPGGMTCAGSGFGNCCSQYSYCGSGNAYCGKGCQAGFGRCNGVSSSSSSSASSITLSSSSSSISSAITSTESATSASVTSSVESSSSDTSTTTDAASSSSSASDVSSESSTSTSPELSTISTSTESSTAPFSTTTTSATCSAIASVPTFACERNPTCEKLASPSFLNTCPSADMKCIGDYSVRCNKKPDPSSRIFAQLPAAQAQVCIQYCNVYRSQCAQAAYDTITRICVLHGNINGIVDGGNRWNTFTRTCPEAC